jgi:hypothetical protein
MDEKMVGPPHTMDPESFGSRKPCCMSIITNAVVAMGQANAHGRALGSDNVLSGAILSVGKVICREENTMKENNENIGLN